MRTLVAAEFRKITTTKMWWALLIPTAGLALIWSWIGSLLISKLIDGVTSNFLVRRAGIDVSGMSWSLLIFARTINISAIFPMLLGALAMSSEITRRTVTTSFLTGSRGGVLAAKLVTYAGWGAAYGVVVSGVASIGLLLGSNAKQLPDATSWIAMALVGVLSCIIWSVLGVGVGALLGNVIAALIGLLVYTLLAENLIGLMLTNAGVPTHVAGSLINGSADGLTGSLASRTLLDQLLQTVYSTGVGRVAPDEAKEVINSGIQVAAGAQGAFDWWASGLIFAGWAAVFVALGWLVTRTRDIT